MTSRKKNTKNQPQESGEPNQPANLLPSLESASSSASEDLLAEARRELIEAEQETKQEEGVIKKLTGRIKAQRILSRKTREPKEETKAPQTEAGQVVEPAEVEESVEEEAKVLLEALDKAETAIPLEMEAVPPPLAMPETPTPVVPAPVSALPPVAPFEGGYHDLREKALEGYEEPKLEAVLPKPTIDDKINDLAGRVKYQTLIRITVLSLTAVVCMATFLIGSWVWNFDPLSVVRGAPPPTVTATLPAAYPIQLRMTGGWMFVLSRGNIKEGKWSPIQSEWLEGTEICRWVSLPWSEQLEAVFRTLKPGARIDLVMSNYDFWTYRVRSVEDAQVYEISEMNKNYPSLLLILTKADSDTRIVVLAVP